MVCKESEGLDEPTANEARERSAAAWRLARRQHGAISRAQLLALGFSRRGIQHRLISGRLWPLARGVFSVGPPRGTDQQRWTAAVLVCGEGACLSHRSAAALWGIGKELQGRVDVSVRRRFESRRDGLKVHSRPSLAAADVGEHDRIPVTSVVQTLVDLATELPLGPVERAVNEADKYDLIDPETLRAKLEERTGEPGVKTLVALLDKRTFRLSDQDLERLFRPIAAKAGFPVELTKAWVNDFEVDFYWPSLALVVETDGLRYHRTASEQARDRVRDQTHTAAGLTQLRFTHYQVKYEPRYVEKILALTAKRLA